MSRKTELSEKHWQALELLSKDVARKDVAEQLGWKRNYLDQLCSGAVAQAGGPATLFKAEYQKIKAKSKKETDDLIEENMKTSQRIMKKILAKIEKKKETTPEEKKLVSMYTNAIAKCKPPVNIKNLSYSYTKGLTAEELVHEFKRLKTVAESSFERERVPSPAEGRAGELSEVNE